MAEEKERGAEAAAGAFRKAEAGVEVAGDAGLGGGEVVGIVDDAEAVDFQKRDGTYWEGMLGEVCHAVVVSLGEYDGDFDSFEPLAEYAEDVRTHSILRVDEIPGDDEAGGFCFLYEKGESFEIGLAIAFRNGDAPAAEGGGFSEVDIGNDKHGGFFQKRGVGGE